MSMLDNDLSHYYKRELSYLRGQGAAFASRYPKIASQLALHGAESLDPHTERLIEAVAFLTARVHRDLDQELPELASALLDNLCPTLTQPVPSMSVAQFRLDPSQGKVTSGFVVPRHTMLTARTTSAQECRFRTAWPTTLWPLQVSEAYLDEDAALRLTLQCTSGMTLAELEIDTLRLHLCGDWMSTMPLYDALLSSVRSIQIQPATGPSSLLPRSALREVGYAEDEQVLPAPGHAQPAYTLLQEFFAFPRKFHFFDITRLCGRLGSGTQCQLVFQLDRPIAALRRISAEHFALGCTPIVNLFPRVSEPVRMDRQHYEYRLVPDLHRDAFTEIHSIESVIASSPDAEQPVEIAPFSALDHLDAARRPVFWTARREHSLRSDIAGTDMFLSFVDAAHRPQLPLQPIIYANLLCTNRRLAEQVPVSARLLAEGPPQPTMVRCLYEPTAQRMPALGSETLWRLVSLLTLNHQSLVDGPRSCERLRELLVLFASESRRDHAQIRGLTALNAQTDMAHTGQQGWRGYCRGTHVQLEFDEDAFVGSSSLMLSAVLARFFALYTSVNSFVRLSVLRGEEVRKQWEPMTGRQVVL